MKDIESFATKHPLAFGTLVTFVFIVMVIISTVSGNLWPGEEAYGQPGGILGRLISIIILFVVLSRLGWLRSAGFTSLGRWGIWLTTLLVLAFAILASAYAMTGGFEFNLTDPALTGLVILFILTAAFLEEVVFRGLMLHGFVRAWGSTKRGLIKSVLVSSLFFCSIHLLDILGGRPLTAVLLQSLEAIFLGIFLAALVLSGKSIYPAAFFHGVLNIAGYLTFGSKGLEPGTASWLLLSLFMLPLALYGLYLLSGIPQGSTPVNIAFSKDSL